MSTGTDAYFVFVRCWLGFSENFPYEEFTNVDDASLEAELCKLLVTELWCRRHELAVQRRADALRKQELLRQRATQYLARPRGANPQNPFPLEGSKKRQSRRDRFRRLAHRIGWHNGASGIECPPDKHRGVFVVNDLTSPRILLNVTDSLLKAQLVVSALEDVSIAARSHKEIRQLLNPRYSVVSGASMPAVDQAKCVNAGQMFWSDGEVNEWAGLIRHIHPDPNGILNVLRMYQAPAEAGDTTDVALSGSEVNSGRAKNKEQCMPRLVVSLSPAQITIDRQAIALTVDEATCLSRLLQERDWISAAKIGRETLVTHADRIIKHLRESKLKNWSIIETAQHGSRIRAEWLV